MTVYQLLERFSGRMSGQGSAIRSIGSGNLFMQHPIQQFRVINPVHKNNFFEVFFDDGKQSSIRRPNILLRSLYYAIVQLYLSCILPDNGSVRYARNRRFRKLYDFTFHNTVVF